MQLLASVARQYTMTSSIMMYSESPVNFTDLAEKTRDFRLTCKAAVAMALLLATSPAMHAQIAATRPPAHDFPTSVRADYVVGCLAANGFEHQKLDACACSIDEIANRMTYDEYEEASTVLSMQQAGVGPRGGLFRDTPQAKQALERLRRAQAEANLRCGS